MTQSERSLAAILLRTRVAVALGVLGLVGIAHQTGLIPGEVLVRGLALGLAAAAAAAIDELASRRGDRELGLTVGIIAELFAFALGSALFAPYTPLAPGLLVWPIMAAAIFLPQRHVVYLAAAAALITFELTLLLSGPDPDHVVRAIGWGALYLILALLGGGVGTAYRRAQRHTESAYASIVTLSAAASYSELGQIVFAYLERSLDLPAGGAAALVFDELGTGTLTAVETRGLDPEARARFRLADPVIEPLQSLAGTQGVWIDPRHAFPVDVLALPEAFRTGMLFVAPLRDEARIVGFAFARREGARRLAPEAQAALARLSQQIAVTAIRIRAARAVEVQRAAMAAFLDARAAGGSEGEIAAWLGRNATEVSRAAGVLVFRDTADGGVTMLLRIGFGSDAGSSDDVAVEALPLVREIRRRGIAIVVSDGRSETRIQLPAFLRRGSSVCLPIHGQGAYLFVHRADPDGFSAANLQLLVMLSDQAALLFDRAARPLTGPIAAAGPVEVRLAALVARTREAEAIDERVAEERARIIDALRLAVEGNQPQLEGSGERVAAVATAIAAHLGCDHEAASHIYIASLLRDVGELGIDRRILDTPGVLTPEQRQIMEQHPVLGETILATLRFLAPAAEIVKSHHERWDGSGYPYGLAGAEIPLGARIVSVADAFVAMTSRRPHRSALAPAAALAAIIASKGTVFDPAPVDALVTLNAQGALSLAVTS